VNFLIFIAKAIKKTVKGVIPARDAGIQEFYQAGEHRSSRFTLKYNN